MLSRKVDQAWVLKAVANFFGFFAPHDGLQDIVSFVDLHQSFIHGVTFTALKFINGHMEIP
jgi:hypothetical protein